MLLPKTSKTVILNTNKITAGKAYNQLSNELKTLIYKQITIKPELKAEINCNNGFSRCYFRSYWIVLKEIALFYINQCHNFFGFVFLL